MHDKKVLIITYYWPPSGGSGVQRWLKFVKYLPSFGWKPYVFTPENPSFELKDESLLKDVPKEAEVIRFPIWEPYSLFNFLSGKRKESGKTFIPGSGKQSLFQKFSVWLRGNFIIPDPRVFWVRPSVKFLSEYLKENQITTIITTGPPHSIHLIGLKLKKKNPSLKWLADFRDPWSEWGFLDSIGAGVIAKALHRRLERKVLQAADKVITITPFYVKQFERLSGRTVNLLTNGFDEADFKNFTVKKTDKFLIRHIGIVNEKCDPRPFMKALRQLCNENDEIKGSIVVEFVGEVHPLFIEFVKTDPTLTTRTKFTATVPHRELIDIYGTSSMLLLILNGYKNAEGYMPGKLFEYLATGLPILGVGPSVGNAATVLNETKAGVMMEGESIISMKETLTLQFKNWKNETLSTKTVQSGKYSRRAVTEQLVELLE